MAFSIIWSGIAYEDLREIVRYIALDNPIAASKLADRIMYNLELASEHPYMNRPVPEKADDSIREIILKPLSPTIQSSGPGLPPRPLISVVIFFDI